MSTTYANKGYVVHCDALPRTFLPAMEGRGLVRIGSRTVAGCYVEPAGSLAPVLNAIESLGVTIYGVRRAGSPVTLQPLRGAPQARLRLRDERCAEWLPTIA